MYNIGFRFDNNHVWGLEELKELQELIVKYNFNNFNVCDTIHITSSSKVINHDFTIEAIYHDIKVATLQEI